MPLHVHKEMCFSKGQVKQLLRCLKLSTVEVLYNGLIQYSAFTGSHLSFDMGIDFLSNFFLQVKETGDPAEQQNQKQGWLRSRCNFCNFCLVVWNLFTLDVNLVCGTSSCN